MSKRNLAFLAVFSTAVFYGLTYSIAKGVMPTYVKPYAFIWIRVAGATLLFWLSAFFVKSEKIPIKDLGLIAILSSLAIAVNMLSFYKGLALTTPINASAIMVSTPIIVFVLSIFILKEKIVLKRVVGIVIGLLGALLLIFSQQTNTVSAPNIALGNFYVFINAAGYALYMILVRKLIAKYSPLVFVKWLYTFGFFWVTPFAFSELMEVEWKVIPFSIYGIIVYVIIFTTYCNFLFNSYGIKHLKPSTVSAFLYTHPVLASFFALLLGSDNLTFLKVICTGLIFLGVYLVGKK